MNPRRPLRRTFVLLALGVALAHLGLLGVGPLREPAVAAQPAAATPVLLATAPALPAAPVTHEPAPAAEPAPPRVEAPKPAQRPKTSVPSAPKPQLARSEPSEPVRDAPELVAPAATDLADAAPPDDTLAGPDDAPRMIRVAAAQGPRASAAVEAAQAAQTAPPPVYRTRIPPAAKLVYRLTRSGVTGSGTLDWKPDGASYTLKLEGKLPLIGTLITQVSRGGFDRAGLAPVRFTDKRLSKAEQAANFQRARGQITFSGPSSELPIVAGAQDRLSVRVQLAAVAAAWTRIPAAGEELQVYVVGARGDGDVWTVRYVGRESVRTADGRVVDALKLLREPSSPHGTRAEFWLDPAQGFLPARARLTDGSGDALELLRDGGAS